MAMSQQDTFTIVRRAVRSGNDVLLHQNVIAPTLTPLSAEQLDALEGQLIAMTESLPEARKKHWREWWKTERGKAGTGAQ